MPNAEHWHIPQGENGDLIRRFMESLGSREVVIPVPAEPVRRVSRRAYARGLMVLNRTQVMEIVGCQGVMRNLEGRLGDRFTAALTTEGKLFKLTGTQKQTLHNALYDCRCDGYELPELLNTLLDTFE